MATYSRQTRNIQQAVYVVPTPAAYTEVYKAISAAINELESKGKTVTDDAIIVTPHDEDIRITITLSDLTNS